jgi:hypothetical protein
VADRERFHVTAGGVALVTAAALAAVTSRGTARRGALTAAR